MSRLPQYAMFDDRGPAEVPAEPAPSPAPEKPASQPEPEPYPAPECTTEIGDAQTLLAPWWDGRLIWGSVDRAAGYRGRPGWYRLHGATAVDHDTGPLIVLDVSDRHGTRWTDTRLPRNTIHAEARPGETITPPPAAPAPGGSHI